MKSILWTTSVEAGRSRLRRFDAERYRADRSQTFGGDLVIAPMAVTSAGFALFLDVRHFPTRSNFAIPANHAPARESREAEKTNETHTGTLRRRSNVDDFYYREQYLCR
jgi:hypothetical protein